MPNKIKSDWILFVVIYFVLISVDSTAITTSSENATPDIIGSSVVTSVSVILGNDQTVNNNKKLDAENNAEVETTTLKQEDDVDATFRSVSNPSVVVASPSSLATAFLRKSGRKDNSGVHNVIQALKSIVQEEQNKHDVQTQQGMATSTAKNASPTSPVVQTENANGNRLVQGSAISGEDDDEMESSGVVGDPGPPTTDAIDDFAKHVVSVQPDENEQDNDTATSAEVNDAIHKISGAILSLGDNNDEKRKKPIEIIVTDVLTKINTMRNETQMKPAAPTTAAPPAVQQTTRKTPQSTTKTPPKTTTTKRPHTTTSKKPSGNQRPSTTPKPTTAKPSMSTSLKPSASSTSRPRPSTTIRPKPVQTTTKVVEQNQNQLKTELEPDLMVKEEEMQQKQQLQQQQQQQRVKSTTMNPNPIIMLEKVMPPVVAVFEETIKKPVMKPIIDMDMNKDKLMDKPQELMDTMEIEMMDKPRPKPPTFNRPPGNPSADIFDGEYPAETTEYKVPGLPIDVDDPFVDDSSNEHGEMVAVEYTTLRPYVTPPTKNPLNYFHGKRPGHNDSTSSLRPNEFYDDEIFGYDPYQTFFHGVYVPVVEVGAAAHNNQNGHNQHHNQNADPEDNSSEEDNSYTNTQAKRPSSGGIRPQVKNSKPLNKKENKPMPTLPDHLHRPRPSHLQYQHGAIDDTESDTGLLNVHFKHPGSHSYSPEESISPDKLSLHPRPALPQQVRKNFTDHHDHHTQHQHGIGGNHGHGGHGDQGHGSHDPSGGHGGVPHLLHDHAAATSAEKRPVFAPAPKGNPGLEATITSLDEEKRSFVDINNRLALRLLSGLTNPVSKASTSYGNMVISPFTVTSSLGMLFLGSRGHTAAQLDGLLRMDDMLTFNPHMMFHNITESFLSQPNTAAAMIRLLITDKEKGDVLDFYKTRVQHFYEARVEEVDYKFAGHLAQSIINQMIRAQIQRHSYEMLNYSLPLGGPMSLLTAAFFDGQFAGTRDLSIDSMNFIHLAALNQGPAARRLFQVPALGLKGNLRAAYDKDLDATAVEIPYSTRELSLIAIMPGKPGEFAFGGVNSLKARMTLDSWTKLMRGFYPRDSFKVVLPRFRHQTSVNLSHTLSRFGLTDMFQPALAKFSGVNRLGDLSLDQNMMHFAEFGTWEKLSDTLTESGNKNLDLIRILRPHVREHYGNYGEPMSVNEWIFKSRNPSSADGNNQRSQSGSNNKNLQPDDVSRLRMELERLRRRQKQNPGQSETSRSAPEQSETNSRNTPIQSPFSSYTKVRSTKLSFRPRSLPQDKERSNLSEVKGQKSRSERSKNYYFRQESDASEEETVLRFERPFLYVLRHNPTGMILMTGQYTEPVTEILE